MGMQMSRANLACVALMMLVGRCADAQPRISDDRDLTEIDLSTWSCRDQLGGSAKTGDGVERN